MTETWTEQRMQCALTSFGCLFYFRRYVVVPNVSWGIPGINGEVDLLCMSASRVLHEVEIKISRADIRADARKRHAHMHECVAYSWFAVPDELAEYALETVPDRFGVIAVRHCPEHRQKAFGDVERLIPARYFTTVKRRPKKRQAHKISEKTERKLLQLGVMKMWSRKGSAA